MKVDFLQIGFEKCGTEFILRNIFAPNPHLQCIPSDGELHKLLIRDFILADGFEYDRKSFESKLAEICQTRFTNKQAQARGIISRAFTWSSRRRFDRKNAIDRINDSFPDVKIIMSIRSQPTWIISFYSMWVGGGGLLSLHDFVEAVLHNENLVAHYIDWFPLVSYLYKLFGSDRVLIIPMEEMRMSPQGIANRLFDFLEVPQVQIDESPVNVARSKEILPLRRFLNHLVHFGAGISDFNFNYRRDLRDLGEAQPSKMSKRYNTFLLRVYEPYTNLLCKMVEKAFRFKGRLELEERHLKMIEQRYSDNNKKLSELLGVDLSSYGYP